MKPQRIILAGGSGFMGGVLQQHYVRAGFDVVVLSRKQTPALPGVRSLTWDGIDTGPWAAEFEGADVVINLAGRSVDCRYHDRNRREILESRVQSTRLIGEVIRDCRRPPRTWLNASTATIYRHTFGPAWDETGETGATPSANDAFSVEVAKAWEDAVDFSATPQARKVKLRAAMVMGLGRNSVFPVLRRLTRLGLGGRMGDGHQFVSWVHQDDLCRALDFVLEHEEIDGAINIAAPNPLPNAELMQEMRRAMGMPLGLPAARWMLEAGAWLLRTETELILKSRRVVPGRLMQAGFKFQFKNVVDAIRDLIRRG